MPVYGGEGFAYGGNYVYGGDPPGSGPYVLTLTVQTTVFPKRVLLATSGLVAGQTVTISRSVAGSTTRTAVRGADNVTLISDAFIAIDAEAPFGVLLTYYLTIDSTDAATATTTLTGLTKVALSDAISSAAAEVVILAWPSKRRELANSAFSIGGKSVVVSGQRGGFSGTIDVFVETDEAKNNVLDLLDNATSGIIQIRSDQTLTSDGVDCFVAVLADEETRFSQDGSDERRVVSLDVVETGTWASTLSAPGFTLQDIADAYPGGTLIDLASDYATLLDVALGDFA